MNGRMPESWIWVCDTTQWWCEYARSLLAVSHLAVRTFPGIDELLTVALQPPPAATVVGYSRCDEGLIRTVGHLSRNGHVVLVLITIEDIASARLLFKAGAADVVPRFPDEHAFVEMIAHAVPRSRGVPAWTRP